MDFEIADPELERHLHNFRLDELYGSDETIFALRPDLTLVFVNQGWSRFAAQNGGEPTISERWRLGTSIHDAIPELLRPFFTEKFDRCLQSRSPWQHRYDCSTAKEYREFLMTTYPIGNRNGLLVVNSLVERHPQSRTCHAPFEERYRNEDGMIMQCVHCRRVNRGTDAAVWDWVPEWLEARPQNLSHGFCQPCYGYFYPGGCPPLDGYPEFLRTVN